MKTANYRIGEQNYNNQGLLMTIIEYNSCNNIIVEFEDGYAKKTKYQSFCNGSVRNENYKIQNVRNKKIKNNRLHMIKVNKQGYKMEIIEYNDSNHMKVLFHDDYGSIVNTSWKHFEKGCVKNPYAKTLYGIGILGQKYPTTKEDGHKTKEYHAWKGMIKRSFFSDTEHDPSYINVTMCDSWLIYENFYDWTLTQQNYEKWKNNTGWCVDKDIIKKGNQIYCPEYCCLVPPNVNILFIKNKARRGECCIGVTKLHNGLYMAQCGNPFTHDNVHLGNYQTEIEAFNAYKEYKETCIKKMALYEYSIGNISQKCFNGMMKYQIEITD